MVATTLKVRRSVTCRNQIWQWAKEKCQAGGAKEKRIKVWRQLTGSSFRVLGGGPVCLHFGRFGVAIVQGLKNWEETKSITAKGPQGLVAALTTSPCSADLYTPDTISLCRSKNNASSAISCLFFQAQDFGSRFGPAQEFRLAPERYGLWRRSSFSPQPFPGC